MAKQWMGTPPIECDLCRSKIKDKFVDGATRQGPWGCLCQICHKTQGVGLGMGKGQMYQLQGKNWVKIGG